ncbi:MAG: class I SAM-dependent methyltransferase [Paludibacteraceae bacterium]|nr:class I SAM-dependent methyltransferase [Paludibacteraceae bacterium]MBN2786969.1 class I SAM-dependent methyltransferase [Paludibacteraceae bacterium]
MDVRLETVSCVICNSNKYAEIYKGKGKHNIPLTVCVCKKCGFSFLNPRWTEESYLNFYKCHYDKYYRAKPSRLPHELDTASYYLLYQRFVKYHPNFTPKNVLDIGSGDGAKLEYIIQQLPSTKFYALESSVAYKEIIESKGIHFVSDDVNSNWNDSLKGTFDLVIMRHTLEHFLNPLTILEKLRSVLSESGVVYIAVPDAYNLFRPIRSDFFRVVHPYYFSADSLKNLLNKARLDILTMVEGDQLNNQEMYLFAKKSSMVKQVDYNPSLFEKQKQIYEKGLKEESGFCYTIKRIMLLFIGLLVGIKKLFFPKPIAKQKQKLPII